MMQGDDIKKLIPQRHPMMMVDEFEATSEQSATTMLTIRSDNYFLLPGQELSETGLIEHIAQSASALAGYQALSREAKNPPVGLIGEIKHYTCHRRVRVGEVVHTTVNFGFTFGAATLTKGECRIDDELIAEADMKIFIQ